MTSTPSDLRCQNSGHTLSGDAPQHPIEPPPLVQQPSPQGAVPSAAYPLIIPPHQTAVGEALKALLHDRSIIYDLCNGATLPPLPPGPGCNCNGSLPLAAILRYPLATATRGNCKATETHLRTGEEIV